MLYISVPLVKSRCIQMFPPFYHGIDIYKTLTDFTVYNYCI